MPAVLLIVGVLIVVAAPPVLWYLRRRAERDDDWETFVPQGLEESPEPELKETPRGSMFADAVERYVGDPRGPQRSELGRINDSKVRGWLPSAEGTLMSDALGELTPREVASVITAGEDRLYLVHASEDGKQVFKAVDLGLPLSKQTRHVLTEMQRKPGGKPIVDSLVSRFLNTYLELLVERGDAALREMFTDEEMTVEDIERSLTSLEEG